MKILYREKGERSMETPSLNSAMFSVRLDFFFFTSSWVFSTCTWHLRGKPLHSTILCVLNFYKLTFTRV